MAKRSLTLILGVATFLAAGAAPALACGGLVAPNGTVNLLRTTTLAAYHDGVEHYVTSFEFAGGGAEFGSIIPLPGVPTKVIKGGDWTLQRLQLEVNPPVFEALAAADTAAGAAQKAVVLVDKNIDALHVTVLKGGGDAVGQWAGDNGFQLPPDAPEVLDFYADRSPIFMAVRFDPDKALARGQNIGDGTPVHLVIPTPNPWVPLRILGLGKQANENIEADVFLLTDRAPAMLPKPDPAGSEEGIVQERSENASELLLSDLGSDRGMGWVPDSGMWLTYLKIDTTAGELNHDLALDASGFGEPSPVAAGFSSRADLFASAPSQTPLLAWVAAGCLVIMGLMASRRWLDAH